MSMVNRTFLLSHSKYHKDNFNFIIKTFLDYPINFIFETINLRLRSLLKHKILKLRKLTSTIKQFRGLPSLFLPCIYNKFKSIVKNHNVKLSFFSLNKFDRIIKAQKDVLSHDSKKNIVYKIKCKNCNASYVG